MNRRFTIFSVLLIVVIIICLFLSNIFHSEQTYSQNKTNFKGERGNTLGNNINCGFAGRIGDWIYYSSLVRLDEPETEILCRENIKTGKKEKISNDSVRSLNLLEGWVYFGVNDPFDTDSIYRMKLDGSSKKKLSSDKYEFINVVGNYIYYVNFSDGAKIYRMKLDGSERKKINNDRSWCINVMEDWIYFISNKNVYKLSIKSGEKTHVLSENIGQMIVDKEWIYYYSGDQGKLYRVNINGTGKIILTDDVTDNFNIAGGYIYFGVKTGNKSYIYRIDLNGKNKKRIAEGSVGGIIGDWIYFHESYQEFQVPVRVKIDGTSKEILHLE